MSNARLYNKCMLYETRASEAIAQAYAVETRLHQMARAYIALQKTFADFIWSEGEKMIQISFSHWWHFITATSTIKYIMTIIVYNNIKDWHSIANSTKHQYELRKVLLFINSKWNITQQNKNIYSFHFKTKIKYWKFNITTTLTTLKL